MPHLKAAEKSRIRTTFFRCRDGASPRLYWNSSGRYGLVAETWHLRPETCPSQLFKKLATRARNIDSAGHAALAIFHALDDAGFLAALGTCGRFRGIHDLFPVGCLCNFRHSISPDRNVPPAQGPRFYLVIGEYQEAQYRRTPAHLQSARGSINTRRSGALYSPNESYTKLTLSSQFSEKA